MNSFNQLKPEEAERLAILAEELAEAIHVIGKILRHGYSSHHPHDITRSNRTLLSEEIGHIRFIVGEMCACRDISAFIMQTSAEEKKRRIGKYLHHNNFDPFVAQEATNEPK